MDRGAKWTTTEILVFSFFFFLYEFERLLFAQLRPNSRNIDLFKSSKIQSSNDVLSILNKCSIALTKSKLDSNDRCYVDLIRIPLKQLNISSISINVIRIGTNLFNINQCFFWLYRQRHRSLRCEIINELADRIYVIASFV